MTDTFAGPLEPGEDLPLLSDEELDLLTDEEFAAYAALLEAETTEWVLTPKQQVANALFGKVRELCYGGAAGGAKSELILYHAKDLSLRYPGHRTLILRTKFPELRRTLIWRSLQRYADLAKSGEARYRAADKEWHFTKGSVIEFGFCEALEDAGQFLSAEYDCILIDESTLMTGDMIEALRGRLRTTRKMLRLGVSPHLGLFTNPGGKGHDWHKKRYYDPTGGGERIVEMLDDPDDPSSIRRIGYVHATVFDNPFIDPSYKNELMAMSDPVRRAQLLYGDWTVFEGMFFPEFKAERHIIPPFDIPKEWPRVRAIDFGIRHPFCCLWGAFDQDGNCYIYRELYGSGWTATEQAEMILRASVGERYERTVADPSIWNRSGEGTSIAMTYKKAGLICTRAMNARVDGWNVVREYLRGAPTWREVEADPSLLTDDYQFSHPSLRIFAGAAPGLVDELPNLQHDPEKSDDCIKAKDDASDTARYLLMARNRKARKPQDRRPNTIEERIAVRLEQRDRDRRHPKHPVLGRV